jgi:hypothetical protein
MKVPVNSDENFLYQILGFLPIADCAVNEVEEACLIALHQFRERALLTVQERRNDLGVFCGAKSLAHCGSDQFGASKCG